MSGSERFDSFPSDGLEASGSDLEGYDEVVSGLAGALYSELERLIGAHGEGAVTGLMPLAVSALETLEAVCAESRELGSEAALGRQENERLLAQFERERAKRKRTEEKFLELEDSLEHERKTQKSQLEQSASQTRQMDVKAKSYLDMMFQLEEEKASLEKDHKKLLQNYNVILRSLKDLQVQYRLQQSEGARHSGSSTPRANRDKRAFSTEFSDGPSSLTSDLDQGYPESYSASEEPVTPAAADVVAPHPVEEPPSQGLADGAPTPRLDRELETGGTRPENLSVIEDIIETTPELQLSRVVPECPSTSTPRHSEDEGVERNTDSILQELQSLGSELIEELDGGADLLDLGCHVESFVSENAELREKQAAMESARRSLIARVEELACEREELRHQLGDALEVRRAMESKIKELETAVKRAKHDAEEKLRGESDDTEVPAALRRRFTRAEMSRVITERNLYKERLMELQEAVRRSERMRALKEQRGPQTKKSTIWDRFNRLLGISSVPARQDAISWVPAEAVRPVPPIDSAPHLRRSSVKSFGSDDGSETQTAKGQRSEQYRLIRTYVWQEHGRSQLHGWSLPNKEFGERPRGGESADVPVPALVQVRLLDQKDPSTKLWCATGVQLCEQDLANLQQMVADNTMEPRAKDLVPPLSTVWICSGTPSETEVMVIDAGKANHVLDHFSIASCHILCSASVPAFHDSDYAPLGSAPASLSGSLASLESVGSDGAVPLDGASDRAPNGSERDTGKCAAQSGTEDDGDSISDQSQCSRESVTAGSEDDGPGAHCRSSALPTVWLGSQSGRLFVHSACSHWRRCLHSIRLEDCVHSIVYTRGYVVATLGNGTLAIFHRNSDGTWDVTGRRALDLGRPRQNVRCAAPVADKVWCGYRNRIYVINPRAAKIEKWFEVTPRVESQVRHLACLGQGVWVSVRLESTLRLFNARSGQPLQEVDIQPFVSTMFGSGPLGLSFLQVTAMSVFCKRLWIGTGTGIVVSLPLSAEPEAGTAPMIANGSPAGQEEQLQGAGPAASIPYCLLSLAQICFHGHRDAVRFFVAASINAGIGGLGEGSSNCETRELPSYLVMSGGEGYINFRIGDDTGDGEQLRGTPTLRKSERSHLIVWQMKT